MSYEPTIWKKGDKVTSARLNKIENGIQGNNEEVTAVSRIVDAIPAIDSTLAQAGKAADAKAVGDAIAASAEQIATNSEDISELKSDLGDLTDLYTTAKTSLVDAINEVAIRADLGLYVDAEGYICQLEGGRDI